MKENITKVMKIPDGHIRILLATEAYGMGADAPNIRRIVHIGPANSVESKILCAKLLKI